MSPTLPFEFDDLPKPERCILYVELKRFYVSQHQTTRPMVILRDGQVLDVDLKDQRCKLLPGMTERAARNMLQDADFVPWQREDYAKKQREWLDRCTYYSDVIEPVDQHSAFLDFSLHPDPLHVAEELTRDLSRWLKLALQIGMAPSKWVATMATGDGGLALQNPASFVSRLPVEMLLPVASEDRERLKFLGYRDIGQVAKIPFEILSEQFGTEAYTIQLAASGGGSEPVLASYPPDSLADRVVFPEAVECSETILAVCRKWAQRIGSALGQRSVEGAVVKLTLEDDEGSLRVFSRRFSKPLRCFRTVHAAICLLLEKALDRPVLSLRLLISDLKRVSETQTAFELDKSNRRVEPALSHIRTVFGDRSIELGSQKQEPRRVQVLRMWKHATGWQ